MLWIIEYNLLNRIIRGVSTQIVSTASNRVGYNFAIKFKINSVLILGVGNTIVAVDLEEVKLNRDPLMIG